eukprot:CAMPEP_0204327538 /NCGR_PEP_ID=MMETSP0469-20131031/12658_1 /ASSEMBLY_ACC=CAM_ASM_000384 /TAXON_ID=2969 /ORGANISM="Oxyrrhis marina" /LENGTH=185 /DNA_ID=CAMNT_0051309779 /DNA_START=38 /DNA_END=595 /DNA_ORIENTATION=+
MADDKAAASEKEAEEVLALIRVQCKLNVHNIAPTNRWPCQILDWLILGGQDDALDVPALKKEGITHVLNTAADMVKSGPRWYGNVVEYKEFASQDTQDYDIFQHYEETAAFIDEAKKANGKCLIHCFAGVNRSAALCVAYYMLSTGEPLYPAILKCQEIRGRLLTNEGFQTQILQFAQRMNHPLR